MIIILIWDFKQGQWRKETLVYTQFKPSGLSLQVHDNYLYFIEWIFSFKTVSGELLELKYLFIHYVQQRKIVSFELDM